MGEFQEGRRIQSNLEQLFGMLWRYNPGSGGMLS